jgi:hypothetical protein
MVTGKGCTLPNTAVRERVVRTTVASKRRQIAAMPVTAAVAAVARQRTLAATARTRWARQLTVRARATKQ